MLMVRPYRASVWQSRTCQRHPNSGPRDLACGLLSKVQYELADVRVGCVAGHGAVGPRDAFLCEAHHLRPFVDEQLSQSQRGAGSQRRSKDALGFVVVAGRGQAERKLDGGVQVCAWAFVSIDM